MHRSIVLDDAAKHPRMPVAENLQGLGSVDIHFEAMTVAARCQLAA